MTTCADVRGLAAEAAFGLLAGDERAAVLGHLDACDSCRTLVTELTGASEALLVLTPPHEPSAGFEERVLARLQPERSRPHRVRWIVSAAAAIALVVVGMVVGRETSPASDVREITMRAPDGRVVGDAYLQEEGQGWVFVAVPEWSDRSYAIRVTYADGTTATLSGDWFKASAVGWAAVLDGRTDGIREIALIGDDQQVACTGTV